METNLKEMNHAHLLQDRIKPEMSVIPSALWTKRQVRVKLNHIQSYVIKKRNINKNIIFKLSELSPNKLYVTWNSTTRLC